MLHKNLKIIKQRIDTLEELIPLLSNEKYKDKREEFESELTILKKAYKNGLSRTVNERDRNIDKLFD